jgi:hypothetical protein
MALLRHFKRPLSGAPTATATGGCTFFRSASAALVGWTFDPDNGKDQYGSHAIAWSAMRGRPPRSCICRKFNDGAHVPFSLVAARTMIWPATCDHSEQNVVNGILIRSRVQPRDQRLWLCDTRKSRAFFQRLFSLTSS